MTRKAPPDTGQMLDKALAHHQAGNLASAEKLYRKVIKMEPGNADALHLLGLVHHHRGRHGKAAGMIERALKLQPGNPMFLNNLGEALRAAGEAEKAAECYRRVLEADPASADALCNLGLALIELGEETEAEETLERAIAAGPGMAEAHAALGGILAGGRRFDEAAKAYQSALEIQPGDPQMLNNLGNALAETGEGREAVVCYRQALAIDPGLTETRIHLGMALSDQGLFGEAADCFRDVLDKDSENGIACAQLYRHLQMLCRWREMEELEPALDGLTRESLDAGKVPGESPFVNVSRAMDPELNFRVAQAWSRELAEQAAPLPPLPVSGPEKKQLTIGYLSCDYHDHATAHLMLSLFGLHDRGRFRIHAYSYGPDDRSAYRKRIEADCEKFVDLRDVSDRGAAELIRADGVDILVELKGHTRGSRMGICAFRPAPVQATYLGFPGTSGADFLDYVITDTVVTPANELEFYSEAPVFMPGAYQVNDHSQPVSENGFRRADLGLPEEAVVFCSFNQAYKIEPVMFGVWMGILEQVPESVLWLLVGGEEAQANLRAWAKSLGIESERLIFADQRPKDAHLERTSLADLVLDTRIYTGHTSTSDALWAGVPVIATEGSHFASRVSASLLRAVGMEELIAADLEAYGEMAVDFASNPGKLTAIRQKLAENREQTPLFNTPGFAKNLEKAFESMWSRHQSGEKPSPVHIR